MLEEINAAVAFLVTFMQSKLSKESLEEFRQVLSQRLQSHYAEHWCPTKPTKGSGYRCLRINSQMVDSLLDAAAKDSGIDNIQKLFPLEFTMWIDPNDVAYRIGENGGSIGQVYKSQPSKQPLPSADSGTHHSTCAGEVCNSQESRQPLPLSAAYSRSYQSTSKRAVNTFLGSARSVCVFTRAIVSYATPYGVYTQQIQQVTRAYIVQ